jgi:hypothetical protein
MLFLLGLVVRVLSRLLVGPRNADGSKDLEILVLRHQLRVLRRKSGPPNLQLIDRVAHFADFATLVRRNSPPCFAGFRRALGGRASGRRRASIHPLILTSFELPVAA